MTYFRSEHPGMRKVAFFMCSLALAAGELAPLVAQAKTAMTAADYARAEQFMPYNVTPLVYWSGVRGNWLPDDRFWYRVTTPRGSQASPIDPAKATKVACDLPE